MPDYFALGTTLAAMVNVSTLIDDPQVLDGGRIPSLGSVKTRSLDAVPHYDGWINSRWIIDVATDAARIAFNTAAFGDQVTAGRRVFISSLDDTGFYSPFSCVVDRPVEQVDYALARGGVYVRAVVVALTDCLIQYSTKTSNYSVTTSDRFVKGDTTSGNVTLTLPAVAGVVANTVYSFHKVASGNSLILDGNGAELIDGATTKTLTTNGARVDLYTNGTSWITVNSGTVV